MYILWFQRHTTPQTVPGDEAIKCNGHILYFRFHNNLWCIWWKSIQNDSHSSSMDSWTFKMKPTILGILLYDISWSQHCPKFRTWDAMEVTFGKERWEIIEGQRSCFIITFILWPCGLVPSFNFVYGRPSMHKYVVTALVGMSMEKPSFTITSSQSACGQVASTWIARQTYS